MFYHFLWQFYGIFLLLLFVQLWSRKVIDQTVCACQEGREEDEAPYFVHMDPMVLFKPGAPGCASVFCVWVRGPGPNPDGHIQQVWTETRAL